MTESILDAVEAVEIVQALENLTFWTANDMWSFDTENDDKVCILCSPFSNQIFPGDQLKGIFPYCTIRDDMTINANVHEPRDLNCRCVLNRVVRVGESYYHVRSL
jgi:hypothetical protein